VRQIVGKTLRPNRQDPNNNLQYRRQSDSNRLNVLKISIVLIIAIGIVVVTLFLTTSYGFNSGSDEGSIDDPVRNTSLRPLGSGGSTDSNFLTKSSDSSDSSNSGDSGSQSGVTSGQNSSSSGTDSGSSTGQYGNQTGNEQIVTANSEPESTGDTILSGCTIHGRVTDDWGAAMVGVRVYASTLEGTVINSVSDSRGRYTIPGSSPDIASIGIALTHINDFGESFSVMNGSDVISLSIGIDPEVTSCEINFDSWNVQSEMIAAPVDSSLWPDATSIYQYTLNAEALAINLGADLENATMLQVQAWCDDPILGCDTSADGAYFIAENEIEENSPPIIAMLPQRSSANSPGIPDNREYHEYGHYFLSLQTGDNFELPAGDTKHGGYYENSSTRDSFVEGFAEFYSMMVSRHIDDDSNSEIYTMGADYDLEADRLPWEAEGWWEEFTVAGLLLDLIDDDSDYAVDPDSLTGVNILDVATDSEASGTIITGSIINTSPLVVRNADVTVRYLNDAGEVVGTQITRVLPEVIAPTRKGTFYAAPPAGLEVSQATATLGGIAKSDDEDASIDLLQIMSIITEYERPDEEGRLGVSTVAELHDALMNSDSSTDQIDDIFVNHGFFADLDGDHKFNPDIDGAIGTSSHPVSQLGDNSYSAFIPRQDPDGYEGSFVKINTGDASVNAIIQISMPAEGGANSYAYVAPKGGSNEIELAVPGADQDAEVTIITAGEDYKPVIALRVQADNFHEKIENGTISELQISVVEVELGTTLSAPAQKSTTVQFSIMIGGVIAVFLVVASLIAIRRQWGKA